MPAKWSISSYSRNQVKKAGVAIRDNEFNDRDLEVASNWRASHSFPLNTIQNGIRRHAKAVYPSATISQRLKRLPSIVSKLQRVPTMKLTTMQDIAGCRVVVRNVDEVYRVAIKYMNSDIRHVLKIEHDYMQCPKRDGYRSLHIVAKYNSDKTDSWNRQLIEIQIRTLLQHSWATAVETVDLMQGHSLKLGKSERDWSRFFRLTGSLFSVHERCPRVAYVPRDIAVVRGQIRDICDRLNIYQRLANYRFAFQVTEDLDSFAKHKNPGYLLLQFSRSTTTLKIDDYRSSQLAEANAKYTELEKQADRDWDVVLVKTSAFNDVKRSYPNYFLDTTRFLQNLDKLAFAPDGLEPPDVNYM